MERTKFEWDGDQPDAFQTLARAAIGRPLAVHSPLEAWHEINAALLYAAPPKPRLGRPPPKPQPGVKSKPLPQAESEGDEEYARRKDAQLDCRRLILPKTADETSDVFLRRLDTHQSAPEAVLCPAEPKEAAKDFVKRMVATKKNWAATEAPGILVLPRSAHETDADYDERLKVCEKATALVVPRGEHESKEHYEARLAAQAKAKCTIMPKSRGETGELFAMRCTSAKACSDVIHPYDVARESEAEARVRIAEQKHNSVTIEPGDDEIKKRAAEEQPVKSEPEPAPVKKEMEKLKSVKDVLLEKEGEPAWTTSKRDSFEDLTAAKEAPKEPEKPVLAPAPAPEPAPLEVEKVDINAIGFMSLKKLLISRGVPEKEVQVPNKFMLKEVSARHDIKIEWT